MDLPQDFAGQAATWERVVRRLKSGQMPPADAARPPQAELQDMLAELTSGLDAAADAHPDPGRTSALRRLTRTEYQHAIADLLAVEIDATRLLPPDPSSHGFDNVTVGELSPTLLSRYLSAAEKISRLALGRPERSPGGETYRLPGDLTQEEHVDGLPLGTRGGLLISHTFPREGTYEIRVRLMRDRNEEVEGLRGEHQLDVLLDRRRVATFRVKPPRDRNHNLVDAHLQTSVRVPAGPHRLGVTFVKKPTSLIETKRQPYVARFNMHRHPRMSPAVYEVSITGPFTDEGPGDTPSRRRLLSAAVSADADPETRARAILRPVLRRAYRRNVREEDLEKAMKYFRLGSTVGSTDAGAPKEQPSDSPGGQPAADLDRGLELALTSILVSPNFLFRVERDPDGLGPGEAYPVSDLELASRLSFFLWSSIPDDELLDAAVAGRLHQPDQLQQQVRRMLADDRSGRLTTNFASQWLHLRNLESTTPDLRLFPNFDHNLRQAFRRETELLFDSIREEDRSVLDLLRADYTFLNERLATHYGIPGVRGSHFRRVPLTAEMHRGGLLRQGSILTVTSYATRTSPVIRGHWILKNLVGSPPPPPPPNVPALKENTVDASLSIRERLAAHRSNAACAGCHNIMDPIGFTLENFDAVGRWRTVDGMHAVSATGGFPGSEEFTGVDGLQAALLQRSDLFVGTLTEKLLTFGLGRVIEPGDAPAVRRVLRTTSPEGYRFSELVLAITSSRPFLMRRTARDTPTR